MSLADKFKFWRKEIPDYPVAQDQNTQPFEQTFEPSSFQPKFETPFSQTQAQQQTTEQQLQLISAKLDTVKAQLETVLQRLDNLERKDKWRV